MSRDQVRTGVRDALDRLRRDLREADPNTLPPLRRAVVLALRTVVVALRGYWRQQLSTRAAALTFFSLFGLVPTLAIAFAMFKAFGGLEQAKGLLMPRLLSWMAVGSQDMVAARIDEALQNIHGGALGGVGTVLLFLSVVYLLAEMESAFDYVWRVEQGRGLFRRITVYWTIVTVTPTLVVGGVTLPAALRSMTPVDWAVRWVGEDAFLFRVLLPLVLVWLGFALLYLFVPNTRVAAKAAFTGAIVGGSLWFLALYGYAQYARSALAWTSIYGSFAALPIFLLWVYLTWLIVLFGCEVAFAVQHVSAGAPEQQVDDPSPLARELLALRVLAIVSRRFVHGEPAALSLDVAEELHVSPALVVATVGLLETVGLVAASEEGALLPARDPRLLTPPDVLEILRHRGGEDGIWREKDETTRALEQLQEQAEEAAGRSWGEISFADLVARSG
jgi:membrane protein